MADASKFGTLGMFNGFPFCPETVDVSGYDKWITLGGTEKGNAPTAEEKHLSRVNAMKLYWSLYKVNHTLSGADPLDAAEGRVISSVDAASHIAPDSAEFPRGRVCPSLWSIYDGTVISLEIYSQILFASFGSGSIVRMVDSNGDFLGYGVNSHEGGFTFPDFAQGGLFPYFGLLAQYFEDVGEVLSLIGLSYGDEDSFYGDVDYATLSGIPLLCGAFSIQGDPALNSAGSLTASSDLNYYTTVSITFDSLEFYAYP